MNATITNVRNRLISNSAIISEGAINSFIQGASSINKSKRLADAKRFIESSSKKSDVPFYTLMELFDIVIEKGTVGDIKKMGNFISENTMVKVRDAKQTQYLLKRKISHAKGKLKSGASKALDNMSTTDIKKNEAAIKSYENMLEQIIIFENYDRVLDNYNKISKRFNLELLFVENTRLNGAVDTVVELCNRIDTYNMPTTIKFNTVIETAWYGFESNNIGYSKSEILESAVDYFLFKEDGFKSCKDILESTMFYDKDDDMKNISIITEEQPEDDIKSTIDIGDSISEYLQLNSKDSIKTESSDFNDIFNKFKEEELSKDHPEGKLKSLVTKLYTKDVNSIIDGAPDLLAWIRRFFILGTCTIPAIGPVIMIVGFIADKFIALSVDRKEVEKMSKCFSNEIKRSEKKLDTLTDTEEITKLKKYIDSLEKAKESIDSYHNELFTDEEIMNKYESEDNSDFDDDFNFEDMFNELTLIEKTMSEYIECANSNNLNDHDMYNLICNCNNDEDIINISHLALEYPEIFYKDSVTKAVEDSLNDIKRNSIKFESIITKSLRMSTLTTALNILNTTKEVGPQLTISEAYESMPIISESYSAICILSNTLSNENQLLEASVTNTLRMASMKLQNAIKKMSDKEKSVSKSIDIGLNSFTKSVERALTNDNRESIIKGNILPSASKIIKMALVNAGLVAIGQPALAVIGTLGYLGTSAKFKAKERQMLVDEIEIELKMCQKYIDIAEQKNDMKALKQLLMMQRDLERQQQRIKYKMKVELGQKYYDTKNVGDK